LSKIKDNREEVVVLSRTDSKGFTRPIEEPQYQEPRGGRRKKQKVATHNKQGERERYFATDDKYSLNDIVRKTEINSFVLMFYSFFQFQFTREKLNTVEDSNHEFAKLMAKVNICLILNFNNNLILVCLEHY